MFVVAYETSNYRIYVFSATAVFHMLVTAACILFLWTWSLCAGHVQACYCRSLRHSDVADCWSCLFLFQRGLQHHAESRDHPRIICDEACEVGIPGWNGRTLPHQAETQGITMLLKQSNRSYLIILPSYEAQVYKHHLKWCLFWAVI